MQERAIFIYETFFKSLAYQLHTGYHRISIVNDAALEQTRINMLSPDEAKEARRTLLKHGLPYTLPQSMDDTPPRVLKESTWCNTPAHRRKNAPNGAVMRL